MTIHTFAVFALVSLAAAPARAKPDAAQIKRGSYLVKIMGCNDCHTPWKIDTELGMPVPDFSRLLSGHPQGAPDPEGTVGPHDVGLIGPSFTSFKLPFGVVYAVNLTPDRQSGIGTWSPEMFLKGMRTGKHMGEGRPILAPMPWIDFMNATDEDLRAIFAYLRSIPAIKNSVPDPKVPPPVLAAIAKGYEKMLTRMAGAAGHGSGGPPR